MNQKKYEIKPRNDDKKNYETKAKNTQKAVEIKRDSNFDNYKYHEISNKTEKNKKSKVIVTKEGVVIASHDE